MKLVCRICSQAGDKIRTPGTDNIIAEILPGIKLPLRADMFGSIDSSRGVPAPWRNGTTWDTMWCPHGRHLPWALDETEVVSALRNGGPSKLLTDEGEITIDADGINGKPMEPAEKPFVCPLCGKKYVKQGNLVKHMETHDG